MSGSERGSTDTFVPELGKRRAFGRVFLWLCFAATTLGVVLLAILLFDILRQGAGRLSLDFLNSYPSRFPARAGIKSALYGTLWVVGFTALFSFPLGVGAAIYLEEYAPRSWLTRVIETNIANLAGVPSIVYGVLGLAVFVRGLALGRSVVAGAATLALLILPVVIISSQEAIRAVPPSIREAGYGIGATKWQTLQRLVLPMAFPGILTGMILSLSRAIGETAPLIMIGALTFIAFTPESPLDEFTVLPIQIFNWASRPQEGFHELAAAAIIVLLVVLLSMNALAIILRNKLKKQV
ncbi:MAG: phosphate ABC transporter permease PstA [Gemmatimonadetes bacterium]|uniref:Phosphate transport system permease protein PstA n=1 Tax=Candidatus Kutchimonas denitrificans TaxID=3056748 RepID=A0AAE4Z6U2_9BACT|nr:phosphate ABC transporter permease PstA [Gemmatimonadota bacterium]NIR74825.1 phosphate ABC transporter permease PstA [Candidatus Kutchimonas denitrificans]NIR99936.1 phosphate ABC transporter permease PstA [Gemmatimonadota bacterium]NIT65520.1 phosphate ABC transporter permease PstA [Gemmatimonadota bacterium]NIU52490.1 phosphate ABC transporter permease PstA [Gemmatimonadota bacterium]